MPITSIAVESGSDAKERLSTNSSALKQYLPLISLDAGMILKSDIKFLIKRKTKWSFKFKDRTSEGCLRHLSIFYGLGEVFALEFSSRWRSIRSATSVQTKMQPNPNLDYFVSIQH